MEKHHHHHNSHHINRDRLLLGSTPSPPTTNSDLRSQPTTSSEFVLQWGSRKRLRCMKVQPVKLDNSTNHNHNPAPIQRTTARIDRRVIRSDLKEVPAAAQPLNGHLNLRQRPPSPAPHHRVLRNSESSIAMKSHHNNNTNGGLRGLSSPDRGGGGGAQDKNLGNSVKNNNNHPVNNHGAGVGGGSGSSETAHDSRKGGCGGSSSGSDPVVAAPALVWPPKFAIGLTNKEKEEDFLAIKGSKLPHRPKKRAKFLQRTLNLVSPGAWLCDLTLERYEVRERKVTKKRPRGLKAMGNMDSDSE